MNIYKDILTWVSNQPLFLQDATRRLFQKEKLSENDISEIFELFLLECKGDVSRCISVSEKDIPQEVSVAEAVVKLEKIQNPINISSLHPESSIEFNQSGITIIFGENGSGKSSYSRVLKKFCWSRQNDVELKRNLTTNSEIPQSVEFFYSVGTEKKSYKWNKDSNQDLKSIYVYDTESTNSYISSEIESTYKPVGLIVLEQLASVCNSIDVSIKEKITQLNKEKPFSQKFSNSNSKIAQWYKGNSVYSVDEIDKILTFTPTDEKELERLSQIINIHSLNEKISVKKQQLTRVNNFLDTLLHMEKIANEDVEGKICSLKNDYFSRKEAQFLIQKELEGENPLLDISNTAWKNLWNAAKDFASCQDRIEKSVIVLKNEKKYCPLCQQELTNDANQRINRFYCFMNDKTTEELNSCLNSIESFKSKLERSFEYDKFILSEIESYIPCLKEKFESFLSERELRVNSLLEILAVSSREEIDALRLNCKKITSLFSPLIVQVIGTITKEIDELNKSVLSQKDLISQYNYLSDLRDLASVKPEILKYYESLREINKLREYSSFIPKRAISVFIGEIQASKSIEIYNTEFIKCLNNLSPKIAGRVKLNKTRTRAGIAYQSCQLTSAPSEKIEQVLSEGEQKVVRLASFIAECSLLSENGTIIFDDPVTSLDHIYRDKICELIVSLSKCRQIIVFTHDFYFTRLLIDQCKKTDFDQFKVLTIQSHQDLSGICTNDFPYLLKNVQERIDQIKKEVQIIKNLPISEFGLKDTYLSTVSLHFRELLEKTVEDLLTGKSVQRFSKNISCKAGSLSTFIYVNKDDIDFLLKLYGEYSPAEHDGTSEVVLSDCDKIEMDIDSFLAWKVEFTDRCKRSKKSDGYTEA